MIICISKTSYSYVNDASNFESDFGSTSMRLYTDYEKIYSQVEPVL